MDYYTLNNIDKKNIVLSEINSNNEEQLNKSELTLIEKIFEESKNLIHKNFSITNIETQIVSNINNENNLNNIISLISKKLVEILQNLLQDIYIQIINGKKVFELNKIYINYSDSLLSNKRLNNMLSKIDKKNLKELNEKIKSTKLKEEAFKVYLEKKGNLIRESNGRQHYFFDSDGKTYQYRLNSNIYNNALYLACSDVKCKGKATYYMNTYKFKLKIPHDITYNNHSYFNSLKKFQNINYNLNEQ